MCQIIRKVLKIPVCVSNYTADNEGMCPCVKLYRSYLRLYLVMCQIWNILSIIYYQILVVLVLIVYHFENTHLLLVQKHSNFINKLWTITAVHCKYIVSDIIMCHVWTLLSMNQLNMTKRWSQCHNVCVIVLFLLCYYNFSFSYSILCSQYSK